MFRVDVGRTKAYCDGVSRRSFVQLGIAGMASLGLPNLLRARAASAGGEAKDTSVILIWLDGGPSHIDLYDLKPDAPSECRGIWSPIHTNVPGVAISEMFPLQAGCADKFSIIRSLHHDNGDHFAGAHWMLTGHGGANGGDKAPRNPFVGAIATSVTGPRQTGMPAFVAVPHAASVGLRPGYFGGSYLGNEYNPFETSGDPSEANFKVKGLQLPNGLTVGRLEDRRSLLAHFDERRRFLDRSGALEAMDRFQEQAFDLVASDRAVQVFDLSREPENVRDRYGRNAWGQSALLARRLVEGGCTFVTVQCGGWDHHWDLQKGMQKYLPKIDAMVSALFEDLATRGLLDRVLVLMCGEFGRTPKMNNGGNGKGTPGRDHWGHAMSCLIGGGGVKGGRIIGSTDAHAERPKDRPVTPNDLHATMFHVLGVDPHTITVDRSGRPVFAIAKGDVIDELL